MGIGDWGGSPFKRDKIGLHALERVALALGTDVLPVDRGFRASAADFPFLLSRQGKRRDSVQYQKLGQGSRPKLI